MKNTSIAFSDLRELLNEIDAKEIVDSSSMMIQVFCASDHLEDIEKIQQFFAQKFPNSKLMGTTTDGIIDNTDVYIETKNLVTFTKFEKTSLCEILLEHSSFHENSYETGVAVAKALCGFETKLILTITDGINTNAEEYLAGITSVKPDQIIGGGMAADNGKLHKTYLFNHKKVISNGVVAIALKSDILSVVTRYSFDWMPIGKYLKVTKAIKNRVYEIDDIPVVDIYAKYMGRELADNLPQIGIEFPLVFEKDGMLLGRAPIMKHSDDSLTFAGNIQEGTLVRFGVGNIEMILRDGHYQINKMYSKINRETEAVFVYSCMARRRFMNKHITKELKYLEAFSNVSGFFTYGEFFHTENKNQLLNETMTMIVLSESDADACLFYKQEEESSSSINSEHVIAHLANVVSTELADLNENLEEKIKESSAYIYKQAYFDKLTGLPNRLSLMRTLENSIGKVLFLINIDDFTIINDFYGHNIGDRVLVKLSELLGSLMTDKKAEIYKLPSDEYAIIMEIMHAKESIEKEIKRILHRVESEEFVFNGHFAHVSVTISAAFINKNKTGLINADMSLKLAKKAGKDFMIFEEDLKLAQQYEKNIKIANVIKDAIANDKIYPYFQAIFDTKTLNVYKYEALVRLETQEGDILTPYHFLDVSQKIKLYPHITNIMIEKTFSMFELNGLSFSVNLAYSDIVNQKTVSMIYEKIAHYNIASQLTIEILETQEIDDVGIMFDFINNIYALGAKIAIDDFGSGFANFEYMTKIRSDYMKIDGSLIKNIDTDENARLVVETIVVFAQKLGKKTIAEFVHSQEVYHIVKEIGIDYVQGFYFSEPSATLS